MTFALAAIGSFVLVVSAAVSHRPAPLLVAIAVNPRTLRSTPR